MRSPDALVLTRSVARKYFGRDAPLGETLLVDPAEAPRNDGVASYASPHPMRVAAVVEDLPSNTSFAAQVFGSGLAPFSRLKSMEKAPGDDASRIGEYYTYLRLKPGVNAEAIQQDLANFSLRHIPINPQFQQLPADPKRLARATLHLISIAALHMSGPSEVRMKPRGAPAAIAAISAVAFLIVLTAGINFVSLMMARSSRRAVETGVRKAMGARRRDLILQYIGEAMVYVALSMLAAMMLAELLGPALSAFLKRDLPLDYLHDPALLVELGTLTLLLGLLAGAYPAFVLSSFRPAASLKGGSAGMSGHPGLRNGLVVAQFAILVGLIITTATLYRQTRFALTDALRVSSDRVLQIQDGCDQAFVDRLRRLPGVTQLGCSEGADLSNPVGAGPVIAPNGRTVYFPAYPVAPGFFEVFGLHPLAGRFFVQGRDTQPNRAVVINQTALRTLGFASPAAAIGQTVRWLTEAPTETTPGLMSDSEIIGVVPDFSFGTVQRPIAPFLFEIPTRWYYNTLSVRLAGTGLAETLSAVDRTWESVHGSVRIDRQFLDQQLQDQYADTILQTQVIGLGAAIALIIAGVGLFALAASTAERRTKEIGIRKAMGASTVRILRLLIWQFTQPVLWANLIAWPITCLLMTRWLQGFAYHVELPIWLFTAALVTALAIAWFTVGAHAWMVTRAKPVLALRYE